MFRFKHHYWGIWILVGILGDAVVYIVSGKDKTLSYYVRRLLYIQQAESHWRRLGQTFFIVFLGWLGIHIIADCLEPLPYRLSGDYRKEHLDVAVNYGKLTASDALIPVTKGLRDGA